MIEIIIALLMSMGLSTDFTIIGTSGGSNQNQNDPTDPNGPDGLGSTANGTCLIKLRNGNTYVLTSDSKGNYHLVQM